MAFVATFFTLPPLVMGMAIGSDPGKVPAWISRRQLGLIMALLGLFLASPFPLRFASWSTPLLPLFLGLLPWTCEASKAAFDRASASRPMGLRIGALALAVLAALYAVFGLNAYLRIPKMYWEISELIGAFKSSSTGDSAMASMVLRKLGAKAVPALLRIAKEEPRHRKRALEALFWMEGPLRQRLAVAVEVIRNENDEPYFREQAIRAVLRMTRLRYDSDRHPSLVNAKAIRTLGQDGYREVVSALLEALSDRNSSVRAAAAEALGRLDARLAVPALTRALQDKDGWVRTKAAAALARLKATHPGKSGGKTP